MKRRLFLLYGLACYGLFLAVFGYMAAFVGGFLTPKTIDAPASVGPVAAVAIDLLLLGLFAAQHSVMARPAFKRVWTQFVPQPIERSTYALFSCLVCIVLMWQWQGLATIVWDVQQPVARTTLWVLFGVGWLAVPVVSLMINHFDLFGLRQVWLHFRGQEYQPLPFRTPLAYHHVRHPLYLGWALAFWATPTMTAGHLLFAGVMTIYMGLAAIVEERDLMAHFRRDYEDYRRRVPMFVPRLRPAHPNDTVSNHSGL